MNGQAVTLDGAALFGAGPQEVTAGSWERAVQETGFAGLDGVVSMDLGRRGRTIVQRGTLTAASAAALQTMMERIAARGDGAEHVLRDSWGLSYEGVRMETFRRTGPIEVGNQCRCGYEVRYRQRG